MERVEPAVEPCFVVACTQVGAIGPSEDASLLKNEQCRHVDKHKHEIDEDEDATAQPKL